MDKKSEEELERIANQVTAEMIRNLNAPKPTQERAPASNEAAQEADPEDE